MADIKITKLELSKIVDMYETVAPTWDDDHSDEGLNHKAAKDWYVTLKRVLKRNGYNPEQIYKVDGKFT